MSLYNKQVRLYLFSKLRTGRRPGTSMDCLGMQHLPQDDFDPNMAYGLSFLLSHVSFRSGIWGALQTSMGLVHWGMSG